MRKVIQIGNPNEQPHIRKSGSAKNQPKYDTTYQSTTANSGRKAWSSLHTYNGCDPQYVKLWQNMIPSSCGCKVDYKSILQEYSFCFDNADAFFESGIRLHNAVNTKLNKSTVSLHRARMLWRHERPTTDRQRAIVTVANGSEFVEILKLTRPAMQAYANRVDADLIDLDNDTEDWGPLEKFRTFYFATQYEQTLFIDADCVITDKCPDLFAMYASADIIAHDDWSYLYKTDWLERERNTVAKRSGLAIEHAEQCLNSGVVLVNQSAADIWNRPSIDIGTSHCAEQIYLEHQIAKAIYSRASFANLDSRANWQWWFSTHHEGRFESGLDDAWIVHFANAPKRYATIKQYLDNRQPKECCHGMDCSQARKECCRNQG